MTPEGPRHALITPDDHGALLAMTAWFLGSALVLCTATRLAVRFTTQRLPGIDDILIVIAAVFAIASTIAVSLAVQSGFGKKRYLIPQANVDEIQKEMYAATIMYVLRIGVSKFAITTFLSRLACTTLHKAINVSLSVTIVCWTCAITAGVVFECDLPRPWEVFGGKCIPILSFWGTASAVDIVTDVILIFLPVRIVVGLQLSLKKKGVVIFIFTIRIVLIATSIIRLVFLTDFVSIDKEPLHNSIPFAITTQAHSTLSVIVACSPALKPFVDNVRTGMLSVSLAKHGPGTTFGQQSYNMQAISSKQNSHTSNTRSERRSINRALFSPPLSPRNMRKGSEHTCSRVRKQESGNHVYIQSASGRMMKFWAGSRNGEPLSDIELRPSTNTSTSSKRPPPRRPTPPPEELRPDMSRFLAKVGIRKVKELRASEESAESGTRIIKKTQRWDVSYDDYHAI